MFKDKVDKIIASDDSELRKLQLVILEIMKVIDQICRENDIDYWVDAGTLLGARRHGGFIPWDDDCDICMMRRDYNKFIQVVKDQLPDGLVYENKDCKDWSQKEVDLQPSFIKIFYLGHFSGFERASGLPCHGTFVDVFPMDPMNEKLIDSRMGRFMHKLSFFRKSKPTKLRDHVKIFLQNSGLEERWIAKCARLEENGDAPYVVYGMDTPFMMREFMKKKEYIFPLTSIDFEGYEFKAPNNIHAYLEDLYGDYMKIPPEEERVPHILDLKLEVK